MSNGLGEMIRRQRVLIPMTLQELARASGVSPSHLARIENRERFPSARILHKIAKPLGFGESELLTSAGYLTPQPSAEAETSTGQLDPHVSAVLAHEPVQVQRAVVTILSVMKSMAKEMTKGSDCNIEFAEYVRSKYPGTDEDTITMIQDILENPADGIGLKGKIG